MQEVDFREKNAFKDTYEKYLLEVAEAQQLDSNMKNFLFKAFKKGWDSHVNWYKNTFYDDGR